MQRLNLTTSTAFAALITLTSAIPATAQFLANGSRSIEGSLCVGNDCVAVESYGFDTLRLKENNLRLHFDDTSTAASFPPNDWRLYANDSANGGSSYFGIEDATAGRFVFRVFAGARSNALTIDSQGDLGLGTTTPATDIDIKIGDTPTVRLQQDGSSGFTPQTWDMAGNEAGFFIRDATAGSTLPFRILTGGAPSQSLVIDRDGNIGMGAGTSPDGKLHTIGPGVQLIYFESSDEGPVQVRMRTDSGNRRFLATDGNDSVETQIVFANDEIKLAGPTDGADLWATVNGEGIQLPAGSAFSVNGTNLNVPDYVFAPNYELMPLHDVAAFIDTHSHLPHIPSAAEIREDGLDLTKMQLAMLKSHEEMMLHIIAQDERIEALEARLSAAGLD